MSSTPTTRTVKPVDDADDVQVTSDKGHMDPAVADAGIAPQRDALTQCYTQTAGRRSWLGGHVVLHWDIAADGAVTAVRIAESDLGAWPIESCLLEVARGAAFGKPVGGPAELTLPLDLSTARTLAIAQPPLDAAMVEVIAGIAKPGPAGKGHKPGKPARTAKSKAVKPAKPARPEALAGLDACAAGKAAIPDDVTLTLYVGPHGRVESVGFASPTASLDDAWSACAEKAAMTWRVPESSDKITKHLLRYGRADGLRSHGR